MAYDSAWLAEDEAHLWTAPDDICQRLPGVVSLLSPDERARAARYRSEKAARSFLSGRVLLRLALSRHYPVRPQDWSFLPGLNGRPFIAAPEKYRDIRFSISHTEGLAACLTSQNSLAAVDVEKISPWEDLPHIAPTVLSAEEYCSIGTLTGDAWHRRFFEYWTLKEAYAKALGVGLGCDFQSVSFDLDSGSGITARFAGGADGAATDWQFLQLALGPGFAGAVAVRTGPSKRLRLVHAEIGADALAREVSRALC